MFQIRQGVFETNSSSTHSITMCSESEFKKWMNGELYFNSNARWDRPDSLENKAFVTKDEAICLALSDVCNSDYYSEGKDLRNMSNEDIDHYLRVHFDIYTYDGFWDDDENLSLTPFKRGYTTENGDKVIAFGRYGYDY